MLECVCALASKTSLANYIFLLSYVLCNKEQCLTFGLTTKL